MGRLGEERTRYYSKKESILQDNNLECNKTDCGLEMETLLKKPRVKHLSEAINKSSKHIYLHRDTLKNVRTSLWERSTFISSFESHRNSLAMCPSCQSKYPNSLGALGTHALCIGFSNIAYNLYASISKAYLKHDIFSYLYLIMSI